MGVAEGEVQPRLRASKIQIGNDKTFQMRYIMSLNSHWFQKYKPLKLNDKKTVHFSTKTDIFLLFNFDGWYFLNQWEFRDIMYLIWKV